MLQNVFMLLVERLEWAVCEKNRKKKLNSSRIWRLRFGIFKMLRYIPF